MLVLFLLSCNAKVHGQVGDRYSPWTVEHARDMIEKIKANDRFVILDTRTPAEFDKDHLADAHFLDFSATDFWDQVTELDTTKTYLVYCHDGGRSGKTARFMRENGFREVHNMQGGILDWKRRGYPVIRRTDDE